MPWDAVSEILDVEGPLETRGKEPAKGREEGCEAGHRQHMELIGGIRNARDRPSNLVEINFNYHQPNLDRARTHQSRQKDCDRFPDLPFSPNENRVRCALHPRLAPSADAQFVDGAYHVIKPHEIRPPQYAKDHGAPKRAYEAFDGLFG